MTDLELVALVKHLLELRKQGKIQQPIDTPDRGRHFIINGHGYYSAQALGEKYGICAPIVRKPPSLAGWLKRRRSYLREKCEAQGASV